MKTYLWAALLTGFLLFPRSAGAQDQGYIDFNESVSKQIEKLEVMVGGDTAAYKQAVILQWLVQLYTSVGRLDDAKRCFETILSYYPGDVGTLNSYAAFLMDQVDDPEAAEAKLKEAYEWGTARESRSMGTGMTLKLWADLKYRQGEFHLAANYAEQSLDMMGEVATPGLLRTAGRAHLELGQFDQAADLFVRLIAGEGGVDTEDINELKLFVGKTTRYSPDEINDVLAEAIERARDQRHAIIASTGGEVISISSEGGVLLEATLRRATGPGAVLFIHDLGARRGVFTPFEQLLFLDDVTTLSIDLRGHGASRSDTLVAYALMSEPQRDQLVGDIIAGLQHLESLGYASEKVVVVAEGNASGVVEKALYRTRLNPSVLHLSPVFDEADRELRTAISFRSDRPTLLIYASEDISAMNSISLFRDINSRAVSQKRYERAGHGVEVLRNSPEALAFFTKWILKVLGPDRG